MRKPRIGSGALFSLALACLCLGAAGCAASPARFLTENVVLVTVDGLRTHELFRGLDVAMLEDAERSGIEDVERVRALYHRATPQEARESLLPFFWQALADRGVVFGNRALGSSAALRNPLRFSYPGYAELLTGAVVESITSNDKVRIGTRTWLDFVADELQLDYRDVAVFASWDVFPYMVSREEGRFFCNAGYEPMPPDLCSDAMRAIDELQREIATPWDSVRHDAITARLALGYLREHRPRVLYVALGETDDWAHERRYDRVLAAARVFDGFLRDLWTTLQSLRQYRGRTTLIITTDHGRGRTLDDWTDHGENVPGAEEIWIAVIGPDTPPVGEATNAPPVHLSDIAATVLELLELDVEAFNPEAGPLLRGAVMPGPGAERRSGSHRKVMNSSSERPEARMSPRSVPIFSDRFPCTGTDKWKR